MIIRLVHTINARTITSPFEKLLLFLSSLNHAYCGIVEIVFILAAIFSPIRFPFLFCYCYFWTNHFQYFSILFEGFFSKNAIAKQASVGREFDSGLYMYLKISAHTSASYSSILPQSLVVSFWILTWVQERFLRNQTCVRSALNSPRIRWE